MAEETTTGSGSGAESEVQSPVGVPGEIAGDPERSVLVGTSRTTPGHSDDLLQRLLTAHGVPPSRNLTPEERLILETLRRTRQDLDEAEYELSKLAYQLQDRGEDRAEVQAVKTQVQILHSRLWKLSTKVAHGKPPVGPL